MLRVWTSLAATGIFVLGGLMAATSASAMQRPSAPP